MQTMIEEINSTYKNEMWHFANLLQDKTTNSTKWIYKEKLNTNGSL